MCLYKNKLISKRTAFTLAETLITLGIIAVVAALTISSVIQNSNQIIYINKLKKEYSLLQQVFQIIVLENNSEFTNALAECPNKDHACLKNLFKAKLNVVADCDTNGGKYLSKCFVSQSKAKQLNGKIVDGYAGYFNSNNTAGLILNDSSSMSFWLDSIRCDFTLSRTTNRCGWLVVDVNGPNKNPNTWGKDLYLFFIFSNKISPAIDKITDYANYKDDCGTGTNYGLTCAGKFLYK